MKDILVSPKAGKIVRVKLREAHLDYHKKKGVILRAPIVATAHVSSPCCACMHWRANAGQELLRQAGGAGALNEAGLGGTVPQPESIGLCDHDGCLVDPFATCTQFKLGNWKSPEEAAVLFSATRARGV